MQMGRLMKVNNNRIDLSEIPFIKYLDKNIQLTLINHKELKDAKEGSVCIPFGRSVYSIWTNTRLALSHYTDLQESDELKYLFDDKELPEIKCDCALDKDYWFRLFYEEEEMGVQKIFESIKLPKLICQHCGKEWGRLPDVVLDIYLGRNEFDGIRKENEIIVPDDNPVKEGSLMWVMFDDAYIDWERTGNVYITQSKSN